MRFGILEGAVAGAWGAGGMGTRAVEAGEEPGAELGEDTAHGGFEI